MKKKIIIFGVTDAAELAYHYFTTDSDHRVEAFCVDKDYLKDDFFCGLPVVSFEEATGLYPPENYGFFVAMGYSKVNQLRKEKYLTVKMAGYRLVSYISSRATVLNNERIGENCFILENNTIQPFVTIEDNVTLWSGNHIGHHTIIHSHCFIASQVVISGRVNVEESCFIGVNATLRDNIRIGANSVIGAGTLVLADVDPGGVYIGTSTERSSLPSTGLRSL